MKPSDRLHVLVDASLSSGQKLSQACHAVAQLILEKQGVWENNTIVILDAPRDLIQDAIQEGAVGFQDTYYKQPRAAAYTEIDTLTGITEDLSLAK